SGFSVHLRVLRVSVVNTVLEFFLNFASQNSSGSCALTQKGCKIRGHGPRRNSRAAREVLRRTTTQKLVAGLRSKTRNLIWTIRSSRWGVPNTKNGGSDASTRVLARALRADSSSDFPRRADHHGRSGWDRARQLWRSAGRRPG